MEEKEKLDGSVVGAYPWTVRQVFDKDRFNELRDMRVWENQENFKFLKGFDHLLGQDVYVTYGGFERGGGSATRRYKGKYLRLAGNEKYGYGIILQQPKQEKHVNGRSIVTIEPAAK